MPSRSSTAAIALESCPVPKTCFQTPLTVPFLLMCCAKSAGVAALAMSNDSQKRYCEVLAGGARSLLSSRACSAAAW